ncbi:helix-turn-helix domain-containing protein [Polaromonas sp.]|uniref:helix-turn-helix domain-containing protein n=1 Tax=Polaromonas sp. TaxID=1869339 RepID=UPI003BA9049E
MNIATALKAEISRVSRKEVRTELLSLKKTTTKLRSDNADLKRRLAELEKLVKQLGKGGARKAAVTGSQAEAGTVARFSGKGLAAQRKRLGLSAANFGKLIGVSGASVYLWEESKTRPRATHMPGIAAVRGIGKKEAEAKLAELT